MSTLRLIAAVPFLLVSVLLAGGALIIVWVANRFWRVGVAVRGRALEVPHG